MDKAKTPKRIKLIPYMRGGDNEPRPPAIPKGCKAPDYIGENITVPRGE